MNLFNKELVKAYPDPIIREDRINLIAQLFSSTTDKMYEEWRKSITAKTNPIKDPPSEERIKKITEKIEKYGPLLFDWEKRKYQKEINDYNSYLSHNLEESARILKENSMSKQDYLTQKVKSVRSIFDSIYKQFDPDSIYAADNTSLLKDKYKTIQDSFWSLAEEAISIINYAENITIRLSDDVYGKWNKAYITSPVLNLSNSILSRKYTNSVLSRLSVSDERGIIEKDDLGFPRLSNSANVLYIQTLLNFGIYKCRITVNEETPSNQYKEMLLMLGDEYPIIRLLYSQVNGEERGIIAENNNLVSFFKGYKYSDPHYYGRDSLGQLYDSSSTHLFARWFLNINEKSCGALPERTVYNDDGTINIPYAGNWILPLSYNLLSDLSNHSFSDTEYGHKIIEYLDSPNIYYDDLSVWESLLSVLRSIGIGEDSDFIWRCLISSTIHKKTSHLAIRDVLTHAIAIIEDAVSSPLYYSNSSSNAFGNSIGSYLPKRYNLLLFNVYHFIEIANYMHLSFDKSLSPYRSLKEYLQRNFASKISVKYGSDGVLLFELDNHEKTRGIVCGYLKKDITNHPIPYSDLSVESHDGYSPMLKYSFDISDEKRFLFFDTETTGLPINPNAPSSAVSNWPRLIQLSWILTNDNGIQYRKKSYIIKPSGFIIPKESSWIHGITMEVAMEQGNDIEGVLKEFLQDCNRETYLVGHNILFDKRVVGAELLRIGIKDILQSKGFFCTMNSSIAFCKIPGRNNSYKSPTLQELYIKLFGVGFKNAHDSSADVSATAKCFWELVRKGIIDLNKPQKDIEQHPSSRNIDEEDKCLPF